jgi:hypothetical protein
MNAVLLCLCLGLCLTIAYAQADFTANFEMRHPFMNGGVVRGTVAYSWPNRAYKFSYTTQGYNEIFQYNPARGFDTASDKPFFNQWQYKWGRTCACETGPLNAAMPQFFMNGNYTATGQSVDINGVSCAEYNKIAASPADVTTVYFNGNTICRAVFDDLREYTFTGVSAAAQTAATFAPPSGCKCGQPVDIAIVLDRSGSISISEFTQQKAFVTGFTSAFAYGPLGANLALIHFNTPAWTSLTMTEGVSDINVNNAVSAIKCCTTSTKATDSCCCCGTAISSGMRLGVDQLKLGRARVEKVLLVVTDGYANHDQFGNKCLEASGACRDDLKLATEYAKTQVPGVKIYAVGVGADRDVSMDELMIIADNKTERVIRYTDFDALAAGSLDLVARACQENLNPCGGCCGFCVCGQCTAPDACDSSDFCNPNALNGVCCKKTPKDCIDPNNKCNTYKCDSVKAECVATPTTCKTNTSCYTYACEAATGVCGTKITCDVPPPECVSNAGCDDGNMCTNDICDVATGTCRWENTAAACDDNNLCTVDSCDPAAGCKNEPVPLDYCDDQSNCTIDRCDPAQGCVNTNVTCVDDNACTIDTCDPFKGCLNTPKVCPNSGKAKCKLDFCLNGTCVSRKADGCAVPVVAVAAALSTAAIIGIIIGVVLCVAGVGAGGAYAYSQAAGSGSVAPVANNPIYVGSGAAGTNPLYKS